MVASKQKFVAWTSRGVVGALFLATLALMIRQAMTMSPQLWELALTTAILAVPLALIYFAIGLLAEIVEQELLTHHLTRRTSTVLRWTPRIGVLLFAAFVSLFALDVFGQEYGLWETLGALLMHLIPTGILLVVLAVAWRWPLAGGLAFLAVAGLFLMQWGRGWGGDWTLYLLFIGPLVVIGILFLANWWLQGNMRGNGAAAPGAA